MPYRRVLIPPLVSSICVPAVSLSHRTRRPSSLRVVIIGLIPLLPRPFTDSPNRRRHDTYLYWFRRGSSHHPPQLVPELGRDVHKGGWKPSVRSWGTITPAELWHASSGRGSPYAVLAALVLRLYLGMDVSSLLQAVFVAGGWRRIFTAWALRSWRTLGQTPVRYIFDRQRRNRPATAE
jgi:hypothetical protein